MISLIVIKIVIVLLLIMVFNLVGYSATTPEQTSSFKSGTFEVHWNSLTFKSDNFLGTTTTEARLAEVPVDEIEGMLIASPQGLVLKPSGTKVFIVTINSTIDPLIGSDELLVTRLWFAPQEATALQRVRLRKGKEKWEKTYRWTENGVYRLRIKPKGADEEELPIERWTNVENSFYPYDLDQSKCGPVSGPSALLYVVSATDLAVGDQPLHLCVFNKKQLHLVRVRAEKHQFLKIDYLEKSQHKEIRKNGKAEVIKISVTSRSLFADEVKAEPFSFLGLKGDFYIYVDKVSKIPVQVSGNISGLGKVKIRLHRVELKK